MHHLGFLAYLAASSPCASPTPQAPRAASLGHTSTSSPATVSAHIEVVGLRSATGFVAGSLFASARGFPRQPEHAVALAYVTIDPATATATLQFTDLPPGRYAAVLFHDENANRSLDTNFLGIPREGVAASNDAQMRLGPPKFKDAVFEITDGGAQLQVHMVYR